jgi:hypothetical protein
MRPHRQRLHQEKGWYQGVSGAACGTSGLWRTTLERLVYTDFAAALSGRLFFDLDS